MNCSAISDPYPGVQKTIAFDDPKGTGLELFSTADFVDPREVIGVGPVKLGHVAFVVSDPKQMAEFYGRVLGFRVSDWVEDFFVFLRCGPDHHTVNFLQGSGTQRIHHVAFELRDAAHRMNLAKCSAVIVWKFYGDPCVMVRVTHGDVP